MFIRIENGSKDRSKGGERRLSHASGKGDSRRLQSRNRREEKERELEALEKERERLIKLESQFTKEINQAEKIEKRNRKIESRERVERVERMERQEKQDKIDKSERTDKLNKSKVEDKAEKMSVNKGSFVKEKSLTAIDIGENEEDKGENDEPSFKKNNKVAHCINLFFSVLILFLVSGAPALWIRHYDSLVKRGANHPPPKPL